MTQHSLDRQALSIWRILSVVFFAVGLLGLTAERTLAQNRSPNILVFIADDAGWRDSGAYGNEIIRTPNIDELAGSGLKFNEAYLTTSSCSPSRISLLSGKYPHETGTEDLHMPVSEDVKLLPSYLREVGYHTGLIGKGHLGEWGKEQFEFVRESTAVDRFESFLDIRGEKPFFSWIGFREPHRPHTKVADEPHDPARVRVPPYLANLPATREDLASYYDEISHMDTAIGAYIDELESRGLRDNTFVVFLSDNGAPFPGAKGTVYDEGIKTPLIVSWPNEIEPGAEYAGLTSLIDFAPTVLNVADIPVPKEMSGRSIVDVFRDQSLSGRAYVFSERNWHDTDQHIRSVRTDRYKLITNAYTKLPFGTMADFSKTPSWYNLLELKKKGGLTQTQARLFEVPRAQVEFYNLAHDPWEVDNVADEREHAKTARNMAQVLEKWRMRTDDHSPQKRRRDDIVDRITGMRYSWKIPPFWNTTSRRAGAATK